MRIDLNSTAASQIASEKSTKQVSGKATNQVSPEDTTAFSSDTVSLSSLAAQAMQSPKVRQDRVDELRQAINNGTYKVDAQKIASSMLNEKF